MALSNASYDLLIERMTKMEEDYNAAKEDLRVKRADLDAAEKRVRDLKRDLDDLRGDVQQNRPQGR
jgi:polyhydroxyalkanoate synthesis regulator phasin